jgi:hypothetical protein
MLTTPQRPRKKCAKIAEKSTAAPPVIRKAGPPAIWCKKTQRLRSHAMRLRACIVDDRARFGIACALSLIAVILLAECAFRGALPETGTAGRDQASVRTQAPVTESRRGEPGRIDPTLRLGTLFATETSRYEGTGRNLFEAVTRSVTPNFARRVFSFSGRPQIPQAVVRATTGLRFFGFSTSANSKSVFLLKGEDLFIAKEGETIDRRYRVTHVRRDCVEVEDVLAGVKERIFLSTF